MKPKGKSLHPALSPCHQREAQADKAAKVPHGGPTELCNERRCTCNEKIVLKYLETRQMNDKQKRLDNTEEAMET